MKLLRVILFLTAILLFNTVKADPPGLRYALNNVIRDYFEVKNALADNNSNLAANKAGKIVWDLNTIPTRDMTPEQHTLWFNYLNKLQIESRYINESGSIDKQKENFAALSNNFFAVLKSLKLNDMAIYWQFCPRGRTFWLSETTAIKNPYAGPNDKDLRSCGQTREVLNISPIKAPAKKIIY